MAGHTPWTFGYVEDSSDWVIWGAEDKDGDPETTFSPAICTLSSSCGRDEAQLIAAAPELLEATRSGAECILAAMGLDALANDEERDSVLQEIVRRLEAINEAIAKATQP